MLVPADTLEKGVWACLTAPVNEELAYVADTLDIDFDDLTAATDPEERARVQVEDNYSLIIFDVPITATRTDVETFDTIPLGVILAGGCVVTVCSEEAPVLGILARSGMRGLAKELELLRVDCHHIAASRMNARRMSHDCNREIVIITGFRQIAFSAHGLFRWRSYYSYLSTVFVNGIFQCNRSHTRESSDHIMSAGVPHSAKSIVLCEKAYDRSGLITLICSYKRCRHIALTRRHAKAVLHNEFCQQLNGMKLFVSEFRMGDCSFAESYRDLKLITTLQEFNSLIDFSFKIVGIYH